jgi:peptidoglycan/LPS O-acetylase OafA/YrhL
LEPERRPNRLTVIDAPRGLASFAVCWYHLVFANHAFDESGLVAATLRDSARNAWVGVEVFFVISGFVIPYALWRARYSLASYGRFVAKRLVRLDPPYVASIVLCVFLGLLSAHVHKLHGPPFQVDPTALLLHLGYLNAFTGRGWLNPVYWTLAIEFQYYLGMGLLFVLLANPRWETRLALFAMLGLLAFVAPSPNLVFRYLFVFMLGMATFQHRAGLLRLRGYLPLLGLLTLGCTLTLGPMVAAVSLLTALAIAFVRVDFRVLGFLGAISYSLYLVHVPVGGRAMDLLLPHTHNTVEKLGALALSLALSLATAYALYRLVERPARQWSSSIRYRRAEQSADTVLEVPTGAAVSGIAEP